MCLGIYRNSKRQRGYFGGRWRRRDGPTRRGDPRTSRAAILQGLRVYLNMVNGYLRILPPPIWDAGYNPVFSPFSASNIPPQVSSPLAQQQHRCSSPTTATNTRSSSPRIAPVHRLARTQAQPGQRNPPSESGLLVHALQTENLLALHQLQRERSLAPSSTHRQPNRVFALRTRASASRPSPTDFA